MNKWTSVEGVTVTKSAKQVFDSANPGFNHDQFMRCLVLAWYRLTPEERELIMDETKEVSDGKESK